MTNLLITMLPFKVGTMKSEKWTRILQISIGTAFEYSNLREINVPNFFFRFDSGTGHYTQIVWGETTKIGCGATTYRKDSFFRKALVCNYGKAGNFIRTPMYKVGNPCSKCPSGSVCSTRYQGLCVFSGNQPLPIPNRPGVSPSLPSNNLPINPSTAQGKATVWKIKNFSAANFFSFFRISRCIQPHVC